MSVSNRKGPVFDPGLCRCCGSIKKCRVLNVEYEFQGQKEVYSDMFMDSFGLMLSDLEGTAETKRLICATCVARLRDACSFRVQVLLCEEKLLQASIHIHQPNENKECVKLETEAIKEEIIEPEDVFVEIDLKGDVDTDKLLDSISVKKETENEQRKTETEDKCERDVALRIKELSKKVKMMEQDGREPSKQPAKSRVQLKPIYRKDKVFHNVATIVESSFVCPFETSFSDYHCSYCREPFADPARLRAHTERHDPAAYRALPRRTNRLPQADVTRVDCRLCDEHIPDLDTLKTHLTTKHHKYLFPKIKNELLQFKLTLSHLACTECDSTFGCFRVLRNHMAVHFGSCTCDMCGAHFFDVRGLAKHQKIHQMKPAEIFPCEDCGKEFKTKRGLYIHVTTTHKKKPIHQCGKCEEVFFSYALRLRHRIEVHGEKREFPCQYCDRTYDNRKSWREHIQMIHLKPKRKIPKHKCDVCDRLFCTPYRLKEHMTTHTGERNFSCEYCGKSYPRRKALRLHMKTHTENKYRCAVCDATFTQNVSLRNHVKKQHQSMEIDNVDK